MQKYKLLWGLFLLAGTAFGQGVRFDSNIFTSANNVPPGAQSTMYTVPFATITVCGYPAVGNPCANTVPIYSNAALSVSQTNPITADVHGRFGFWAVSGSYSYSVKAPDGTNYGTFSISLGGSGGTSVSLQHNGTALANQSVLNFNDTTPAAPTGNVNVTFQSDSTGKLSAYAPISASSFTLQTTGTSGAATYTSGVLNIPDYTYTLTVPKVTALGTLTNDISGSAAKVGGVAISGVPATGQVPVATGTTTATWQNIAGGLSGQTAGYYPKATTATTSIGPGIVSDDGSTATVHGGLAVSSTTDPSQISMTYNVGHAPAGAAGSAVLAPDTSGNATVSENNAAFSRVCTVANGLCAGVGGTPGGSNTQIQFNNAGSFGGSSGLTWNGTQLHASSDVIGAITAGSATPDPGAIWSFNSPVTSVIHASYIEGISGTLRPTLGANDTSIHWTGSAGYILVGDNFNYHSITGLFGDAENDGNGNTDEIIGLAGFGGNGGTGTATSVAGGQFTAGNFGGGTVTTGYGAHILTPANTGFGTLYGLYIGAQTQGTTNYNLYSAGTTATNMFEGIVKAKTLISTDLGTGTSPVCPNGTGGALTTVGCSGGGGTLPSGSGIPTIETGTTWGPTIPVVPVEAYGAVGNVSCASAADSTTAIQNAINALPASGGKILLQPLCYRVSGSLTFSNSFTGIIGYSGFVYFGGSRIENTSASADTIVVAGADSAHIISRNTFENFSLQRSVNPTTTAKGLSLNHVGSTVIDHVGSADSIYDYYLHDARGVTGNQTLGGFGNNGFSETSGTYYGFYVDTADGLPSNSFITNNDGVACNTGTGATTYGFYLNGAAINDHQHTGFNIGGNCSYGVVVNYTGAGSALTAYDIHFSDSILDAYRTNAIKVMNVPASATASIEFNGGWTNGTGTAIDIETSAGVSVSNMQINCSSCTNAALVNASTGFVFNTNEWIGAPTTHLALTGSSYGTVTGNSFAHAATNGISADATSSSNSGFQTNAFGSGVTNTIADVGSNPLIIKNTSTSGGILQQILSPNIGSGSFAANFVGTALGDGVVYAWRNNTVHNASLETWASSFPIRLSGSAIGLEGGSVYVGNSNSTASNTQPSGGGLFNVGSTSQFQVDTSGNATVAGGGNTVYRCATAGALPVGALTITSADCGTTADTGLRVH